MSMHDVDAPSPPKKRPMNLELGMGIQYYNHAGPHNLCLQIYLGVFFRNIWLSYIYYFFTHFWSNNLRKKNVLNPNPTLTFGASFISIQAFCNTGTLLRRKAQSKRPTQTQKRPSNSLYLCLEWLGPLIRSNIMVNMRYPELYICRIDCRYIHIL